jgi:hypothetical protein
MTRSVTPPILQLQNAESLSSQAAALRALKNETIGHDQRKEALVRLGILPMLAHFLASRSLNGSPGRKGSSKHRELPGSTAEADDAHLQAIILLGSLAQGIPVRYSHVSSSLTSYQEERIFSPRYCQATSFQSCYPSYHPANVLPHSSFPFSGS